MEVTDPRSAQPPLCAFLTTPLALSRNDYRLYLRCDEGGELFVLDLAEGD